MDFSLTPSFNDSFISLQTPTAASGGWTARVTSWRSTWLRWPTTCPAARAPTRPRWRTARPTCTTPSHVATSAGRMPAARKRSSRSTSPPPATASAPCWRWSPPRWRRSTAVMMTAWSSSPGVKGRVHPTSSAQSSQPTCTTKWTSCPGSSARGTGADTTRPDRPTMDRNVQTIPRTRTTTNSSKRQGNSSPLLSPGTKNCLIVHTNLKKRKEKEMVLLPLCNSVLHQVIYEHSGLWDTRLTPLWIKRDRNTSGVKTPPKIFTTVDSVLFFVSKLCLRIHRYSSHSTF